MTKIRFLATGDLHSDKKLIEQIKKQTHNLQDIDYVLLVGDISEKNNDLKDMLGLFQSKPIFMAPGNHETKKKLEIMTKHYGVELIGNNPIQINKDLVIFGSNYTNMGEMGVHEEDLFIDMIDKHKAIKNTKHKIMLSHMPPDATNIGDASIFFPFIGGSIAVREFLEHYSIDMTLVGHIHETSGLEEIVSEKQQNRVLNVGVTFKIIEFDTETGEIKILNN